MQIAACGVWLSDYRKWQQGEARFNGRVFVWWVKWAKWILLNWRERLPAGLNWCDVKTIDQQGVAQANTRKMIDEVSAVNSNNHGAASVVQLLSWVCVQFGHQHYFIFFFKFCIIIPSTRRHKFWHAFIDVECFFLHSCRRAVHNGVITQGGESDRVQVDLLDAFTNTG